MGDLFGIGETVASLQNGAFGLLGSAISYRNAKKLMDRQNAFTERMSNTAYTRATADMRNAGLNPALMYSNGSAASTPTAGSGASAPDVDLGDPVNAAMQFRQAKESILNTRANTAFAAEQAKTEASKRQALEADAGLKKIQAMVEDKTLPYSLRKMAAETEKLVSERYLNDEVRKYTGYNAESGRIQANAAKTNADASMLNARGNYYYNTHRALGFETSESGSDSLDGGFKTPLFGHNRGKSSGYSRTIRY